jgi:hypothetical protein
MNESVVVVDCLIAVFDDGEESVMCHYRTSVVIFGILVSF